MNELSCGCVMTMIAYDAPESDLDLDIKKSLKSLTEMLPDLFRLIQDLDKRCAFLKEETLESDLRRIHSAFSSFKKLLTSLQESPYKNDDSEAWSQGRHDLRACIGGIKGYGELIEEAGHDFQDQPLQEAAFQLIRGVDGLLPLIDRIKAEQHMSARQQEEETEYPSCSLRALVEKARILVIDDSFEKQDLLERRLRGSSHEVIKAFSGKEAFQILDREKIDLILLDILMPEMNGHEVLGVLKKNPNTNTIPVLVISSVSEIDSVDKCIRAGAEDYLPMPINPIILDARINACLNQKHLKDQERKYLNQIEEASQRLEKAIHSIEEGFAVFDAQECLIMANEPFKKLYPTVELLGGQGFTFEDFMRANLTHNLYMLEKRKTWPATTAFFKEKDKEPWLQNRLRYFRQDLGSYNEVMASGEWIEVINNPIPGGGCVCIHKNVTERVKREQEMKYLANHDPLTGLANRAFFEEELASTVKEADQKDEVFALMFFDLDGFKKVNDHFGHDFGDYLLKTVSKNLTLSLRQNDVVARIGGDEFCAIIRGLKGCEETKMLAQRCLDAIGTSVERDGKTASFGVSIGIACYPNDAIESTDLLKKADTAMYAAKKEGKGQYRLSSELIP